MKKACYRQLLPSETRPQGWLKRQLQIQAESLAGSLDIVWPDVRNSKYIGGDREGWERVPYWLDGFVPLAYLLRDDHMIKRAKRYVDAIIKRQKYDGWLCPCTDEERAEYDMWAFILLTKVLKLYYDCSGDKRIFGVLYRSMENFKEHIEKYPLFGWGKARWYECFSAVLWLHEKTGEQWLVELANLLYKQGEDYGAIIKSDRFRKPEREWRFDTHVVNMAQALKAGSVSYLFGFTDGSLSEELYNALMAYHGTPVGHFTGDECLAGKSPIQGAELCSIVESMYSYEVNFAVTGKKEWLDRLETIAFNSLPAAISPDMWSHQYDQMLNQIACIRQNEPCVFLTNSCEANIFGLEPNYGCCTANFGQGWPKLALSTFFVGERELVSAVLLPCCVDLAIGDANVTVELETNYPFSNVLKYRITTDKPVVFTLKIRIPQWADIEMVSPQCGREQNEFYVVDGRWDGESEFEIKLKFRTEFVPYIDDMVSLRHGALFFTPEIEEIWVHHEYECDGVERKFPYCDYEVWPNSLWGFAFVNDKTEVLYDEISQFPFSHNKPPVKIRTDLVRIDWGTEEGQCLVCAKTPKSREVLGKPYKAELKPYGCSALRMSVLPMLKET